ncbi:MAG TPA: pilus assembly protein [Beijerinckiaceae bacterium]|nr:pilus assembly protein [Beijerinckiaceae bacterium]
MKLIDRLRQHRLRKDERGLAATEFALIAPLLITIFIGLIEASNYVYANQKVESSAANVLNIINQQSQPSLDDIQRIAMAVPEVAKPLQVGGGDFRVVYTAIQRDKPGRTADVFPEPYVLWQESYGNPGLGSSVLRYSRGGSKEQNKLNPGDLQGLQFTPGDQVIAVEVYIRYKPTIQTGFSPKYDTAMYYLNFSRPRKGSFSMSPREKSELTN